MTFLAHSIDYRFDGGIQEFRDDHEKKTADQQGTLDRRIPQPQCQRYQDEEGGELLTERCLAAKRKAKSIYRKSDCADEASDPARFPSAHLVFGAVHIRIVERLATRVDA